METKKGIFQTQHSSIFSQNKETSEVETYLKHAHPQNAPNDRLDRNLQYGLKISNEQNPNPNPNHQIRSDAEYRIVKTPEKFNNVTPSPHPYNSHYVQYQKTFQSPHYHPAQVPPASNLSHNVVVQNTPQIWVPQQPHYHHPPQVQKAEYKNINVTSAQQTTARTKDSEKKKSSGTPQLKSPVAKRPLEAPVTMQGWIHKQGSEGLMLWKKRWFVLSEYCLFYYKGPEEEKLLGSILLPSYKVSICKPEEKISKKYAFKCEHANMRTYILAADSQELMKQWIQALNLATMMQTNVEPQKPIQQKTTENYDPAGQHYYKTPFRLTPTTHTHSPSSSILQDQCSFNQPLYANAPPKPRRLNDGFSSPSPDILDRHNPHYMDPRTMDKSPVATYSAVNYNSKTSRESLFVPGGEFQVNHDFERRTPDTYGRSKLNHPHPTDYEDVYAEQQAIYKRPLSPVAYSHVIKRNNPAPINPAHRYYTPVNMAGPTDVAQYPAPQMRKIPSINIARPHSADFLEYELNHKMQDTSALLKQRPRPKSSLEINANTNENDNYFYSKERYAEKMRKSAQYLQNVPPKFRNEVIYNTNEPVRCPAHENTFHFVDRPHHVHTHHMPNLKLQVNNVQKPQPVRSKSVLSEGSLSKEIVMDMDPRLLLERESLSPDYMYGISYRNQEYDPFTRSASARLAAQTPSQVDRSSIESRSVHRDGDRKREESMRRLLEWKQRMLQSPLNRKIQGNIAYRSKNDFYSNNNHETGYKLRKNQKHSDVYLDDSRSKNSNQYNSYSSDDEENVERGKDDIVQSQAGGISDTGRPTPAQSTSTTTLITSADLAKPTCHSNLHDTPYTNVFEKLLASSFNQDDFPKHFKKFTKQDLQHIANFQSEYSHKLDQTSPNPDVKLNVQGKSEDTVEQEQSVLEENYIPMSPSKSVLSPRTSCNSGSDIFLDKSKIDENHYVEMTQNVSGCLLDSSFSTDRSDHQPYELVIFSEDKIEPLYMELKSPAEKVKSEDVPDILATPQKGTGTSKSDSSDADDEASKDLDSLDTPSQPRFSLSDTFRPASYYLGTTQVNTELQDSSDSELVSPPPIPPSPPPLDDLNGGEYVQLKVKDDESAEVNMSTTSSPTINKYLKKKSARIKLLDGKSASPLLKGSDEVTAKFLNSDTDDDTAPRLTPINYVQLIKRRPASKDICVGGEIASPSPNASDASVLSAKNQQSVCNYRDELGINSTQLDFHEYENLIMSRYEGACTPKILSRSEDDSARSFSGLELQHIGRPESSTSTSAEINSFLQNSNRSTPILEAASVYTSNTFSPATAPYYYSDLSINITGSQSPLSTLNNQRSTTKCNKRDISHIKNPIRCNLRDASEDNTFKLAAEARSVSVDFLNLTDKSGHIDDKNIYESDTLQRNKSEHASRNLLATRKNDKFTSAETVSGDTTRVRRSHSLEGLLENVLKDGTVNDASEEKDDSTKTPRENASEGSYLWEEDAIWRERLRSASQRHTKSMEDLDTIGDVKKKSKSKSPRGITRSVTYVNDGFIKLDKQKEHEVLNAKSADNNKVKKEGSFILDREKLRQWDLMSSAPSDNQMTTTAVAGQLQDGNNIVVEITDANCDSAEMTGNQNAASGSISINTRDAAQLATRDTFPRVMSAKKAWISSNLPLESRSVTNLSRNFDKDAYSTPPSKMYYSNQASSHPNLTPAARQENWPSNEKVSVSAGELLGRTHEELVLLLIQLRRQSAQTLQAIENYYNEIDMIQAQLYAMDQARRMENLQKLEQIKQHLLELEKQYEKGKPLVNLVDNMVKLGSLYRAPQDKSSGSPHIRDRLEFNQQIQERRLLAEERREWNRLNSNHFQFQEKVQQLYMLDRLIHEESGTLQNLQQDKEDIERALGGLRHRLSKGFKDPSEVEMARKQQIMLENELSRVHYMLAQNSKKLEETVSGNARLEQELMVLKQKLQNSRQQSSPQYSNAGDSLTCTIGNNTGVESDLQKVEKKIGELQKQRQKLSLQVRQLTDRSPNTSQPKSPSNDAQNSFNKKKIPSLWRETDLDTMSIVDHGEYDYDNNTNAVKPTPLYINSDAKLEDYDYYNHSDSSNALTSESNLVMPQEKQEIKTVRIVKRESEKRQRDREKLIPPGKWDAVQEEENSSEGCSIFKPTPKMQGNSNVSNVSDDAHNPISSPYVCGFVEPQPHTSAEKSPDISPVFKSEAARQIITEMAVQNPNPTAKQPNRRAVPKEKRRHYTAPHNHLIIKSLNQLPNDIDTFDKISVNSRRARDDLDMERALRQRIDAPDVVRSTLINTELKYNERTIDDLLGTPSKINIPERYIPEQLPQLSVEEQEYRLKKVETIKKMLSDTTLISTSSNNLSGENPESQKSPSGTTASKATANILDEKKQREHLLQLNQILAKQVMEMSKIVAVNATAKLANQVDQINAEEEDLSPLTPLPLYQQRDNFYS